MVQSEVEVVSEGTERGGGRHWLRAALAGVLGIGGTAVGFALLNLVGPYTVYNDALQSDKMRAIWGQLEPEPLMFSNPAAFGLVILVIGVAQGLIFAVIARGLPGGRLGRGLVYGVIIWALYTLSGELLYPFSIMGEPLPLVLVEIAVGLPAGLATGVIISFVYGHVTRKT